MTATNHVMTGALIAIVVQRPLLAIPIAFLSHFIIDVLPHFGYGPLPEHIRDQQKRMLPLQVADALTSLALFLLMPYLLRNRQSPFVTAVCMLVAQVPDIVWTYRYVVAQRRGRYARRNWLTQLHKAIQWCERPWGIYVEAVWFVLVVGCMKLIVT